MKRTSNPNGGIQQAQPQQKRSKKAPVRKSFVGKSHAFLINRLQKFTQDNDRLPRKAPSKPKGLMNGSCTGTTRRGG